MRIGFGKLVALSVVLLGLLVSVLIFAQPSSSPNTSGPPDKSSAHSTLMVYCAAGLQPPVAEIVTAYEASHPVTLQTKFGGSGSLLSEVVIGGGDVFLTADRIYLVQAQELKLASDVEPIAYQTPVILVRKGNPKRISDLKDLQKPDVRLSLADPKRAAIGKIVSGLLEKNEVWDSLWKRAVIQRETVNEVGNDVKLGAADAGIVWDANAKQYPDLEAVRVPVFDKSKNEIAVAMLSASKDPRAAADFIRYLVDPAGGLQFFARHGYEVAKSKSKQSAAR